MSWETASFDMERRAFLTATGSLYAGFGVAGATAGAAGENTATPAVHTVTVESWDGTTLVADLYVPGSGDGPYPSQVFLHGSGGSRSDYQGEALAAARDGYVALAPDTRGFGDSGGEWSVNGPKEVADVLVHVDRLADGTFSLRDGSGTVSVPVAPSSNGPTVGLRGVSIGGAIQLQTAAATLDWFESLSDLRIAPVEERLAPLPGADPDSPTAYEGAAPDPDAVATATPNLDLSSSPLDAIVPRIPWWRLKRAVAPNDVVKGAWLSLLNVPNGPPDGDTPPLWRQAFTALTTAQNDLPPEAAAFFERRTPDLAAVAANGVPTLLIDEWNDGYIPPRHGLKLFQGLRAAGKGPRTPPVALAIAPLDRPAAHNWEYPTRQDAAENERVTSYLDALTRAWRERFLNDDATLWNRHRNRFDGVSIYQRQYPDVPARHDRDRWPGWRSLREFPPAAATPETLPLSTTRPTDVTVLGNTVAQSSFRGPTGTFFGSPHADGPGSTAAYDYAATSAVDVATTPRLRLTVTPLGDDAVVFAKFRLVPAGDATGPVVDSQVMPYRLRDAAGERTTVAFDLVPFQRYLSAGDRLRLVLSTTDNAYYNSRETAGLVVHHARPDESALMVDTVGGRDALAGRLVPVDGP